MKNVKDYWEDYKKPTPEKFRKLGDALLSVSLFITSAAIYGDQKFVAEISLICGIAGKFLTNLFKSE